MDFVITDWFCVLFVATDGYKAWPSGFKCPGQKESIPEESDYLLMLLTI